MRLINFTAKKVQSAFACNSCAGWVGGVGNLIAMPAVCIRSTDLGSWTEFYEDRHRAARKVFTETTYRLHGL